MRQNVVRKS